MSTISIPGLAAISKIKPGSLYPHQADGVTFLLNKKRAILADDMGLGKTRQAIVALDIARDDGNFETLLKSLALKILGDRGDPKFLGLAYGIAEAVLEINRIRRLGYDQSKLSVERRHAESTMRRERMSFDAQSNRYLSRAYGRLRSRIRKLDHAMLTQNNLDLQSQEWLSSV